MNLYPHQILIYLRKSQMHKDDLYKDLYGPTTIRQQAYLREQTVDAVSNRSQ